MTEMEEQIYKTMQEKIVAELDQSLIQQILGEVFLERGWIEVTLDYYSTSIMDWVKANIKGDFRNFGKVWFL